MLPGDFLFVFALEKEFVNVGLPSLTFSLKESRVTMCKEKRLQNT